MTQLWEHFARTLRDGADISPTGWRYDIACAIGVHDHTWVRQNMPDLDNGGWSRNDDSAVRYRTQVCSIIANSFVITYAQHRLRDRL